MAQGGSVGTPLQTVQLGFTGIYGCAALIIALAVLVGAVIERKAVRDTWTAGAAASAVVLLLSAPMQILALVHMDLGAMLSELHLPESQLAEIYTWGWYAAVTSSIVTMLLSFLYRVLLVPLAVAARPRVSPYPLLLGDVGALRGVLPGLIFGVVAGVFSVLSFWLLGVTESELAREQLAWFPGVDWDDPAVIFGVSLPVMVAAAISEELLFRGVVQRWLTRWMGDRWIGATVSILVTTTIWTIGHAANTDHLVLKFLQIFCLGLVFGVLARRYSVEASLASHVTLNIIAVIGAYLLGM